MFKVLKAKRYCDSIRYYYNGMLVAVEKIPQPQNIGKVKELKKYVLEALEEMP